MCVYIVQVYISYPTPMKSLGQYQVYAGFVPQVIIPFHHISRRYPSTKITIPSFKVPQFAKLARLEVQ